MSESAAEPGQQDLEAAEEKSSDPSRSQAAGGQVSEGQVSEGGGAAGGEAALGGADAVPDTPDVLSDGGGA